MRSHQPARVRSPAVAGQFYPGNERELSMAIDRFLNQAASRDPGARRAPTGPADGPEGSRDTGNAAGAPKAIIAPHAGYVYSGPVAAYAYAPWRGQGETVERVVLLGPAHRVPVRSMALSSAQAWETPLGRVPIDLAAIESISSMPGVVFDDRAHAPEHSLEVQVPFLQRVLGTRFALVPIIVGQASPSEVADVLDVLWDGDETRIVVSTDLSHYHGYYEARTLDRDTAAAIVARTPRLDPCDACGAFPVQGILESARRHDLPVSLLDLRNSGDTAGPRDRVVGYGAFAVG